MTPRDPIIEQVDRLIGNLLARRSALRIEGTGTLRVVRRPAQRLSRSRMLPPRLEVELVAEEQGERLDEVVARALRRANPTADEALLRRRTGEIVARWLAAATDRESGTLTIGGVGKVCRDRFETEETFDRRLNPHGNSPVKLRRRFDWVTAVGLCAALLTAGGAAWWIAEHGLPFASAERELAVRTSRPAPDAVLPADTLRTTTDPLAAALPTDSEQPATGGTTPADASANTARGADGTTAADSRGDTAQHPEATPARSEESGRAPQNAAHREADATAPAALVSGRHYVVLGVFSTPENAARAVGLAAGKEETFRCGVYRFGGKFMVSPFESEDREACTLFIRAHAEQFPGMWTYTAR